MRQKFKIGQEVKTNFNGKITRHTIIDVSTERTSQSGVTYRVDPPTNPYGSRESGWIDQDWFWSAE